MVAAVGDFDPAALTAQLRQGLGDWTSKAAYTRVPLPYVAIAPMQFRLEVKDKQNAFSLGQLGFPLRESDRDFQALRLGMQIFGGSGGGTGRLWDRIRETDGLSYGVGSGVSGGMFNANASWYVYAISANQNADKVKAAFDQELARARRDGFTSDELKRAKDSLIASSRLARAQDDALAGAFVSFVERGKTPKYLAELDALRAQITLDEVNAAFSQVHPAGPDRLRRRRRVRRHGRPLQRRPWSSDAAARPRPFSRPSASAPRRSWSRRTGPSSSTSCIFASRREPSRFASTAPSSPI